MDKAGLVGALAERTCSSRRDAHATTDALLALISEAVARRESVTIAGFGRFEPLAMKEGATQKGVRLAFSPSAAWPRRLSEQKADWRT
ncbi:MAG: HU family DNA-binding protein [Janthinobacterium lividum]